MAKILWADTDHWHFYFMSGLAEGLELHGHTVIRIVGAEANSIEKLEREAQGADIAIFHPGTVNDVCDTEKIVAALRRANPSLKIGLLTNTARHEVNPDFYVAIPIFPSELARKIQEIMQA